MTFAAAVPKHLGFVALLGVLARIGMIARNSVILIDQVGKEKVQGRHLWDAVVEACSYLSVVRVFGTGEAAW